MMMSDDSSRPEQLSEIQADRERRFRNEVLAADDAYRQRLLAALTKAGLELRVPQQKAHDQPRWYEAQSLESLEANGAPVAKEDLAFPVPPDCVWWHGAEHDSRDNTVFRFFAQRAWIDMQVGEGETQLMLTLHHWLTPQARDAIEVSLQTGDTAELMSPKSRHVDRFGRLVLTYERSQVRAQKLRIALSCGVAAVVSDVHPSSTDHRYLSVAVGLPIWRHSQGHTKS